MIGIGASEGLDAFFLLKAFGQKIPEFPEFIAGNYRVNLVVSQNIKLLTPKG